MKKLITILFCSTSVLFAHLSASAQDSSGTSAAQKINKTSEQSEKLYGKKIQQETISTQAFETIDTTIVNNSIKVKNKSKKCRRRHH